MTLLDLTGRKLGKYRLLRLLGKGGMAEVYLAEHELLESKTAVKVLPEEFARDQEMVGRFLREARSAAGLRHPNIVRIHDVGQEEGVNYFAMDYVDGRSLTEMIASSGGLEEKEIIRLSGQVLSALGEAHKKGIIHRDIKPDNVMVDSRGDAVVMDFGIAKAALQPSYTMAGSFVGTVHYASPEQARGKPVDARSDLYSWGVVMYEMAVGKAPFSGQDTTSVLYQHVHESPRPAHEETTRISAALSGIIDKALSKDPDRRFSSAADFMETLNRLKASSTRHTSGRGTRIPGAFKKTKAPSKGSQAQALTNESQAQMDKGQWAAAQVLAEKALSLNSGLKEAEDILARAKKELLLDDRIEELTVEAEACLADGLYEQAGEVISELVGISRDKKKTLDWLEEVQEWGRQVAALEAALQRGQALEAAEEWQAAKELYLEQNEKFPDQEQVEKALARVENRVAALEIWEKGKSAQEEDDLETAISLFEEALQKDPALRKARKSLDRLKQQVEKKRKMENLLTQAKEALEQEKGALAMSLLNQVFQFESDHPEAKELLPRAEELLARQKESSPGTVVMPAMGSEADSQEKPASPGTVVMPAMGSEVDSPEKPVSPGTVVMPAMGSETDSQEKPVSPGTMVIPPESVPKEEEKAPVDRISDKKPAPQGTVVMSAYKEEPKPEPPSPPAGTVVMPLEEASSSKMEGEQKDSGDAPPPPPPPLGSPPSQGAMVAPPAPGEPAPEDRAAEKEQPPVRAEEEKSPEAYVPPGPKSMGDEYQPGGSEKPGKSKAIIGIGLAAVIVIAVVGVFLFTGEEEKPPIKPPAPPVQKVEKKQKTEIKAKDTVKEKAAGLADQGQKSLGAGQLDAAEKAFSAALELNPENEIAQKGLISVGAERRAIFEAKQRKEAEAKAKAAEEERLRDAKAKATEEERLRQEAELKAKAAEEERLRKEFELKDKAAEEERLRQEAELKAKAVEEERLRQEAELKAKVAEEERLRKESELKAKAAEEERLRQEAELKAKVAEEERLRKEAEAKAEEEKRKQQAAAKYGRMVVGCKPSAKVFVDGKPMGQTPLIMDQVLVGERQVQVKAYGAVSAKKVNIEENKSAKVRFELRGGAIAVNAAPWADLLLDGVPVGATPVQLKDLPLGPHRLSVRRKGYKEQHKDVVLKKGVTVRIKFRLQPE
ncbi:hypothetical protein X474_06730 [Dethiosulfatarculus sandiegensis]|uniref:non-specific serine/threonine protein kinase n=1 Tax=Dethiosulfatarculus sandiegensis TaxID=1429043 RepID=A0A0D2J9L7_9BACT|nr:hypothetical protein X474_06730 [Dethiosulfatarculus sandiegensis]